MQERDGEVGWVGERGKERVRWRGREGEMEGDKNGKRQNMDVL